MFPGEDPDHVARRASSFGASAADYAEARPGYPADAVRWCLADAPGGRVLDLGAGTGKLTETLLGLPEVGHLTAVEPDAAMLAELRRRLPDLPAHQGTAESIPLPDSSVDAVLVGQAMHWFDQESAAAEIARVLVPGGVLAALWNVDDDRVPWLHALKSLTGNTASYLNERTVPMLSGTALFPPAERADFPNPQPRTVDSLLATFQTHSQLLLLSPEARTTVLAKARALLTTTPETSSGPFLRPMITTTYRTTSLHIRGT
ncbi:class I SAM-dependent methyltransferase [Actinocorallia lasiicapitis]